VTTALPTCAILRVSALLANETGNATYLNAAVSSYEFIVAHLYSTAANAVVDGIYTDSCDIVAPGEIDDFATFIEGVAILGAVTQNSTMDNL
jgi:hypothetical protein